MLSIFSSFGADKKLVKPDFINEDTIITLDPDTGKALSSFGKGLFLMPHGLTIDNEGNHYVTDVGLHQVMRVCNFPLHYTTYVMQWPNSRTIFFWTMHPTTQLGALSKRESNYTYLILKIFDIQIPSGQDKPDLVLGTRMEPGNDQTHFCMPTSVAVSESTGDFFVADGYCNSRVMKFNKDGKLLKIISMKFLYKYYFFIFGI